jgi:serine/threonine protein phosphatase PrpC
MTVGGFGDYRHDVPSGVIRRVPEITTHKLVQGDHIILSSDGLYETYLPHGMLGGGRPDENIVRLCSDYSQQVDLQNNSLANFLFESHIEEIANQLRDSGRYRPDTPREVLLEQARKGKDNTVILVYTV